MEGLGDDGRIWKPIKCSVPRTTVTVLRFVHRQECAAASQSAKRVRSISAMNAFEK
jgi:hypothetical protein